MNMDFYASLRVQIKRWRKSLSIRDFSVYMGVHIEIRDFSADIGVHIEIRDFSADIGVHTDIRDFSSDIGGPIVHINIRESSLVY